MAQIVSESTLVLPDRLRRFVAGCLEHAGLIPADAALVADSLVESNLRGIDSHGVARLPHYLNRLRHGSINPRPQLTSSRVASSLGKVDGGHGLGQIVMSRAVKDALAIADESGSAWIAVENSSHCGALAYYGLQIANANMIGIVLTHSDSMVAPYGGNHAFCGTNPICFALPGADGTTMCLDMATSIVPWNTISNAVMEKVEIPSGWALDREGKPTSNPGEVAAVRPFGGYKGSNLGLVVDILCSFLLGSPYGPDIAPMYGDPSQRRLLGGLVGAIDIARFRDVTQFRVTLAELARRWNDQLRENPEIPIMYPGQIETITRQHRLEHGIPLGINLISIFQELSRENGIAWS